MRNQTKTTVETAPVSSPQNAIATRVELAIIIVSWNAKTFLQTCLRSIYATMPAIDHEIWVVDNASSDGTQEMLHDQFPEVKLICNDSNQGFARANNLAIRQCQARTLALVNSDVEVLEGCFETLRGYLDEHPEAGMVGPQLLNPDRTVQRSCYGHPNRWNSLCHAFGLARLFPGSAFWNGLYGKYGRQDTVQPVEVLSGCFWVLRRAALQQVGLLDEDFFIYWEDFDYCKRMNESGWQVVYHPQARAIHYGRGSSSNAPVTFMIETERTSLHYWRKHHGRGGVLHIGALIFVRHLLRVVVAAAEYVLRPDTRAETRTKIEQSLAAIRWLLTGAKR
ncbi:MAG: glycosyltransferase family 2 protein [bacterium]